ncbi:hypothetical protein Pth03_68280 [Planotetraspora thailandica]|uniref:Carbohydrate-binding protein n=1 Tax=Planotetraspora thailandica TaxID=487172 RepID=A0A8J4DD77_9ACTN|nr:hypothetical protein [Planotetraspora thailandica]GII58439.1 hypothetical protein Pth03_68280 [Planotetraspora thailandica]
MAGIAMIAGSAVAVAPAHAAPVTQAAAKPPPWKNFYAAKLTEGYLHGVAAPGPSSAWAVGHYQDENGYGHAAVLRWNGRAWSQVPSTSLPNMKYWYSVSAATPRDVWVYGWNDVRPGLAHFDGGKWRPVAFPKLPEGTWTSYAQLASVRGATWLAGETWVSRRVGGGWKTTALPAGVHANLITARSATDAWLSGTRYTADGGFQPYTARWNGHRWKQVNIPVGDLSISDMWAESKMSVWVTGQVPSGEEWIPVVLHWNGKKWKNVRIPDEGQTPLAISGNGGKVWVTGDPAGFSGPPLYWRFDGRRWTTVSGALPAGGRAEQVTDLAPVKGTARMWAVGNYIVDEGDVAHSFGLIQRDR